MRTKLVRTELEARVEIRQPEELEAFDSLRLSVKVLAEVLTAEVLAAEILREVLADITTDIATEAVTEAVTGLGYHSRGLDTN